MLKEYSEWVVKRMIAELIDGRHSPP